MAFARSSVWVLIVRSKLNLLAASIHRTCAAYAHLEDIVSSTGRELMARCQELAGDPFRSGQSGVKSSQRQPERLGHRDIPGVVARHRVAQLPDSVRKRFEGIQLQVELHQIILCRIRFGP